MGGRWVGLIRVMWRGGLDEVAVGDERHVGLHRGEAGLRVVRAVVHVRVRPGQRPASRRGVCEDPAPIGRPAEGTAGVCLPPCAADSGSCISLVACPTCSRICSIWICHGKFSSGSLLRLAEGMT